MSIGVFILGILGAIVFAFVILLALIPAIHFLVEALYRYDDWLDQMRDKHGHDHHDPH
jgi:hypothetical protein